MALNTKKDSVVYLIGALKRLIELTNLPEVKYKFIYDKLNQLHKYAEEEHDSVKI